MANDVAASARRPQHTRVPIRGLKDSLRSLDYHHVELQDRLPESGTRRDDLLSARESKGVTCRSLERTFADCERVLGDTHPAPWGSRQGGVASCLITSGLFRGLPGCGCRCRRSPVRVAGGSVERGGAAGVIVLPGPGGEQIGGRAGVEDVQADRVGGLVPAGVAAGGDQDVPAGQLPQQRPGVGGLGDVIQDQQPPLVGLQPPGRPPGRLSGRPGQRDRRAQPPGQRGQPGLQLIRVLSGDPLGQQHQRPHRYRHQLPLIPQLRGLLRRDRVGPAINVHELQPPVRAGRRRS
jgi:hypothetical protein